MTGKIFAQIPKIMAEIGAIEKTRRNTQGSGYDFRGIDDVYNAAHAIFAEHGVFMVPTVLDERSEERTSKNGGVLIYRILKIQYRWYADDGSYFDSIVVGEAMDSGDKASNKALSVGQKYTCLQVLLVPTKDEKDPENDSPDPKPKESKCDVKQQYGEAENKERAAEEDKAERRFMEKKVIALMDRVKRSGGYPGEIMGLQSPPDWPKVSTTALEIYISALEKWKPEAPPK